jgi:DNA-3-methyladenine glycosylase
MPDSEHTKLSFLEEGTVDAAKKLIGWHFYVKNSDDFVGGVINETEAYTQADAASHSYKGQTRRNEVMFGPAGRLYVYFTYGMHYCVNIVTGPIGSGEAVLIRSLIPDKGIELIQKRRGNRGDSQLTNGPAKLCQALGITLKDNGEVINQGKFVLLPPKGPQLPVTSTRRIGIRKDTDRLWRFVSPW